ncbi:MAG: hydroxymethylglutaryl-CoA lyase, partial [Myxococcales bacterium]|nr:hydroxymethylglutaryl-CoA lyase [Myxococcales bacterium]
MPQRVEVYEVGPRDGLQNESRLLSTEDKAHLVASLVAAGLRRIEVTSFVSPRWVPQLADAEPLMARLGRVEGVVFSALVPNLKGLARARASGLQEAAVFVSASETHSRKNINKSISEAVATACEVAEAALAQGMRVRGYVSTVWGCPYEGEVPIGRVAEICRRLAGVGLYQLSLGDTIGVGTPRQTGRILEVLLGFLEPSRVALHLHDTRGMALANALVGMSLGVSTLDASVGGLG